MSGGRFNYSDSSIMHELFPSSWYSSDKRIIRDDPYEDQEISQLMFELLNLTHDLDWYLSGDTCEETYVEAKQKFKERWFGKGGRKKMLTDLINQIFEESKKDCMKMIGVATGTDDNV